MFSKNQIDSPKPSRDLKEQTHSPHFYRIEKDSKVSYILGTNHVLPLNILPASLFSIFNEIKSYVMEINFTYKLTMEDLQTLGFIMTTRTDWVNQLSPEEKIILVEKVKIYFQRKTCVEPPEDLGYLNPELVYWMVDSASRPNISMDEDLGLIFFPNVHSLEGIERLEFVRQAKQSLPELKEHIMRKKSFDDINQEYLSGSTKQIALSLFRLHAIIKRNFRWINKIIHYHSTLKGPVLFGFGAGHLYGATGILELLIKFGFRISRINPALEAIPYSTPVFAPDSVVLKLSEYAVDIHTEDTIEKTTKLTNEAKIIFEYLGTGLLFQNPKILSEHVVLEVTEQNTVSARVSDEPVRLKFS